MKTSSIRSFLGGIPNFMSQGIAKVLLSILAAGSLAVTVHAQTSNNVYAVEFNMGDNLFGTVDPLTGNFTAITSLGSTLYNDIAYCPTDGTLYGIQNETELVTFDPTTGAVTPVAQVNIPGLESIAFSTNGVLYATGQNSLYTINPATGDSTFIGSFGSPYGLNLAQNIRFDDDGNLYLSNTDPNNTDIYQVSTVDGSATFVGQAAGYGDLILENGSQYMYGVSIPSIGNGATPQPELLAFDRSSFVDGGTNADGSIHDITVIQVGCGPGFMTNFNFSGSVPEPLPVYAPMLSITSQSDGSVQVTATATIAVPTNSIQTNVLQVLNGNEWSNNNGWSNISTNAATNGVCQFVDSDATNYPMRFYRVMVKQ